MRLMAAASLGLGPTVWPAISVGDHILLGGDLWPPICTSNEVLPVYDYVLSLQGMRSYLSRLVWLAVTLFYLVTSVPETSGNNIFTTCKKSCTVQFSVSVTQFAFYAGAVRSMVGLRLDDVFFRKF